MTPARIKRSSKAPNRFSSDNSCIETSNSNGETIIDYNDNSTSTTHNLAPIGKTIQLKPVMREPLKVKLPKLKRPSQSQSTKEHTVKSNCTETRIHKIKLPSLSSKKISPIGDNADSKHKSKSTSQRPQSLINMEQNNSDKHDSHSKTSPQIKSMPPIKIAKGVSKSSNPTIISVTSVASKVRKDEKSFSSANTSINSSDVEDSASRMEIVVSQPDPTNGSGIRCPCGVNDDLGVMVECESCSTWQHGHCINVGTEEEAYEGYVCAYCILPQDKVRESLHQLTVGDKFLSRFRLLVNASDTKKVSSNDTTENNARFTVEDLSRAIKDLYRVLSSLKVKWRLLTSQEYQLELRIWQNPYWSDEPQTGVGKEKSIYFLDNCKNNLKLNIRNMVRKLEERCQLIEYAIIESKKTISAFDDTESSMKKVRHSHEEISDCVRDFKNKLKNLDN